MRNPSCDNCLLMRRRREKDFQLLGAQKESRGEVASEIERVWRRGEVTGEIQGARMREEVATLMRERAMTE
jgi:hypothetical protein